MNKWMVFFALSAAPIFLVADNAKQAASSEYHFNEINAEELLSWYAQGVDMTVLDARGKKYLNGLRLPGAKWASQRLSDEGLRALIPAYDSLVVVYCSNIDCPAGGWMATRLVKLGFTNVYELPEGIDGWMEKNYPTDALE